MAAKGRIPLKVGVETNADIYRMVDVVQEALAGKIPVFVERGGRVNSIQRKSSTSKGF